VYIYKEGIIKAPDISMNKIGTISGAARRTRRRGASKAHSYQLAASASHRT